MTDFGAVPTNMPTDILIACDYDEVTGQSTTSATLEDITGCAVTLTVPTGLTGKIIAAMTVESTATGANVVGGWAVEINYRELKDHLGLDHFEGRGWVGWHHHVTMVLLAFAFVLSERLRRTKGGRSSLFPRSWAGSSNPWPPGPGYVLSAANPSHTGRGMI